MAKSLDWVCIFKGETTTYTLLTMECVSLGCHWIGHNTKHFPCANLSSQQPRGDEGWCSSFCDWDEWEQQDEVTQIPLLDTQTISHPPDPWTCVFFGSSVYSWLFTTLSSVVILLDNTHTLWNVLSVHLLTSYCLLSTLWSCEDRAAASLNSVFVWSLEGYLFFRALYDEVRKS